MGNPITRLFQFWAIPGWIAFVYLVANMTSTYLSLSQSAQNTIDYLNSHPVYLVVFVVLWVALLLSWPRIKRIVPFLGRATVGERLTKLEQNYKTALEGQSSLIGQVDAINDTLGSKIDSTNVRMSQLRDELNRLTGNLSGVQTEISNLKARLGTE